MFNFILLFLGTVGVLHGLYLLHPGLAYIGTGLVLLLILGLRLGENSG